MQNKSGKSVSGAGYKAGAVSDSLWCQAMTRNMAKYADERKPLCKPYQILSKTKNANTSKNE